MLLRGPVVTGDKDAGFPVVAFNLGKTFERVEAEDPHTTDTKPVGRSLRRPEALSAVEAELVVVAADTLGLEAGQSGLDRVGATATEGDEVGFIPDPKGGQQPQPYAF